MDNTQKDTRAKWHVIESRPQGRIESDRDLPYITITTESERIDGEYSAGWGDRNGEYYGYKHNFDDAINLAASYGYTALPDTIDEDGDITIYQGDLQGRKYQYADIDQLTTGDCFEDARFYGIFSGMTDADIETAINAANTYLLNEPVHPTLLETLIEDCLIEITRPDTDTTDTVETAALQVS